MANLLFLSFFDTETLCDFLCLVPVLESSLYKWGAGTSVYNPDPPDQ